MLRPPDVLLLDYRLPDGNGIELSQVAAEMLGESVPTLFLTGDVTALPLRAIHDSGLAVLHKPVQPRQLREQLVAIPRTRS